MGVGKKMIQWSIEMAIKRNAHVIQLTTDKLRNESIEFYRSIGFKPSHEGMKLHL